MHVKHFLFTWALVVNVAWQGSVDAAKLRPIDHAFVSFEEGLLDAVYCNEHRVVNNLLKFGADIFVSVPDKGVNVLHVAACNSDLKILLALLKEGKKQAGRDKKRFKDWINWPDKDGDAPVHIATMRGNLAVLKALHEADADLNVKNGSGMSPMTLAIEYKSKSAINFFVKHGFAPMLSIGDQEINLAKLYKNREVTHSCLLLSDIVSTMQDLRIDFRGE